MQLNNYTKQLWQTLDLAPRTIANYSGAISRYIAPTLGAKPINEIHSEELLNCLKALPPQTKFATIMALRSVFRYAVEQGHIEASPMDLIKAPRIKVSPKKFLKWDEINNCDFGRQTSRIKFLALHGLRWSEAAALTKDDIRDGVIHVSKSKNGPTKSASGNRLVPYLGFFEVFPKNQKAIAKALKPHGVTVHSLRKTYAYCLKSSKIHVTTASRLMGHSNPMITLKIYTAVLDEEIYESAAALRDCLSL